MPEPSNLPTIPRDVLVDAMAQYLLSLTSEPLTLGEISHHFKIHRSRARELAESIGGQKVGHSWVIPLHRMPLHYQKLVGFL